MMRPAFTCVSPLSSLTIARKVPCGSCSSSGVSEAAPVAFQRRTLVLPLGNCGFHLKNSSTQQTDSSTVAPQLRKSGGALKRLFPHVFFEPLFGHNMHEVSCVSSLAMLVGARCLGIALEMFLISLTSSSNFSVSPQSIWSLLHACESNGVNFTPHLGFRFHFGSKAISPNFGQLPGHLC